MNDTQTIQTFRLTIQDLSESLTEAIATKNLLSIQLAEANRTIKELEAQLAESIQSEEKQEDAI